MSEKAIKKKKRKTIASIIGTVAIYSIYLALTIGPGIYFAIRNAGIPTASVIEVQNDDDFVSKLGCSGAGTNGNPYIIEKLKLNTLGSQLKIKSTRASFVIKNCVFDIGIQPDRIRNNVNYILEISNVSSNSCKIVNNTFKGYTYGILAKELQGAIIANNTFDGVNTYQTIINCWHSKDVIISNNCFTNIETYQNNAIYCPESENVTISKNTITGSKEAASVYCTYSNSILIEDNDFSKSDKVIQGDFTTNITIKNNLFDHNKESCYSDLVSLVEISWSNDISIEDNSFKDINFSYLFSDAYCCKLSYSNRIKLSDNYFTNIVSNHGYYRFYPSFLTECSNVRIMNNSIRNCRIGFRIEDSQQVQITGCSFYGNFMDVWISDTSDGIIDNCSSEKAEIGIYMRKISNHRISNCSYVETYTRGVFVEESYNCNVSNCTFNNCYTGIEIETAENSIITNCIFKMAFAAIRLTKTNYTEISWNTAINCTHLIVEALNNNLTLLNNTITTEPLVVAKVFNGDPVIPNDFCRLLFAKVQKLDHFFSNNYPKNLFVKKFFTVNFWGRLIPA